jgi:hypothetical protein
VDPGSPDAVRLATNPSFVVIEAGETRTVQSFLVNAVGNPVAGEVSFEACNGLITVAEDEDQAEVEPGTNFTITGNTLGESCVNLSAAGFEKTINVRVVPEAVGVVSVDDTLRAGATGSIDVTLLNAAGAAVGPFEETDATFESDNPLSVIFTDSAGSFDTRIADNNIVTVTFESFGVTREVEIPVIVLPAAPDSGDIIGNFGAIGVGDTLGIPVNLFDSINNINNYAPDIDSIRFTSSNPAVATTFGTIEESNDFEGRVVLSANAVGVSQGTATITGTAYVSPDGVAVYPVALGTATVTVLAPDIVSMTPSTGRPGQVVTITGTNLQTAGFTTTVHMDGVNITTFVDVITPTAITLDMPAALTNADHEIEVRVGGVPSDQATWTQTSHQDVQGPANESAATAPVVTFPIDLVGTFVGTNDTDWYQFTLATRSAMSFRLDWTGTKDLDMLFRNAANTAYVCSTAGASAAHPEVATCTLNPGTYLILLNDYSSAHDHDASLVTYEFRGTATPAP